MSRGPPSATGWAASFDKFAKLIGVLQQRGILALIAIGLEVLAGLFLFVLFIWFSYRKHGGLSAGRFGRWAAALVYFWAIWTYTLLPLPDPATLECAGTNLNPACFSPKSARRSKNRAVAYGRYYVP